MPSKAHEILANFGRLMAQQLWDSNFLPKPYGQDQIKQIGSAIIPLQWEDTAEGVTRSRKAQPDASIALFHPDAPFLVLEVAVSQLEKNVMKKAQDYILGSAGKVKFVVIILVDKARPDSSAMSDPAPPTDDGSSNQTFISVPLHRSDPNSTHPVTDSLQSGKLITSLSEPASLDPNDSVYVSVYRSEVLPSLQPGRPNTITGKVFINRLRVYPGPPPVNTFPIRWRDANCGTWAETVRGLNLALETPEPICNINFSSLTDLASDAIGQQERRAGAFIPQPETPPNYENIKFVNSSSPAEVLSSGGTISSAERQRRDPDYEPPGWSSSASD